MEKRYLTSDEREAFDSLPIVEDAAAVYFYTVSAKSDVDFIGLLTKLIKMSDVVLSKWLNITPRTFLNYKKNRNLVLKDALKEHIVLILSLYKHGEEVFGSRDAFESWLSKENRLLDNRSPSDFLATISGIQFIDNRLTAIEYGENV